MKLEERIIQDYKDAMRANDKLKASILSLVRSELNYLLIRNQKKTPEDADVVSIIRKQIAQHNDSIIQFEKGGRLDLVEKETKELQILKNYLPKELPTDKIKEIIEEAVKATNAKDIKDMGKVMKEVMAKISNQADGKLISELVKQRLVPNPQIEKS